MNYDEMPAGPEMDRLVAEKVMGWVRDSHKIPDDEPDWHAGMTVHGPWKDGSKGGRYSTSWQPSINIAHAWEVVETMTSDRMFFSLANESDRAGAGWQAALCRATNCEPLTYRAVADGPALAICRAVLKAAKKSPPVGIMDGSSNPVRQRVPEL